eukprot:SAG25_NODE_102_length_15486_cov_22.883278_11_plen_56_part_00
MSATTASLLQLRRVTRGRADIIGGHVRSTARRKQSGQPGKYKFISRYQSYHGATM